MIKKIFSIFFILIALVSSQQIVPVRTSSLDFQSLSPLQFANKISQSQPATMQKVVFHYLAEELEKMDDKESMKGIMAGWFRKEGIDDVKARVERFMIRTLIDKLEIQSLSEKMKDEIQTNKESYFLTYEMYDLLIG